MQKHLSFVNQMVNKGGPEKADYSAFREWLDEVVSDVQNKRLCVDQVSQLRQAFGEALSVQTLQGFALTKPHGYAGDFEIIDKIYQRHVSKEPHLRRWDEFFHSQKASKAVRNRKDYFISLLKQLDRSESSRQQLNVLNIASGPGRDLYEFLSSNASERITFECVELDSNAIAHATNLCKIFQHRIIFHQINALRFTSHKRYQLVWSAGLFDYFNDRTFKRLVKRLYKLVDSEGELVIGNFSSGNATQNYMEVIGEWVLNHRSEQQLLTLAKECEIDSNLIRIGEEAEGINLFLHIAKP